MFSSKIWQAIQRASNLHLGLTRKNGTPAIAHLFSVALILLDYTKDEDVITAGILHDSIEDTPYTPDDLERNFGQRIKEIVLGISEDKSIKNWEERKKKYLEGLHQDIPEALLVCAADKIDNLISLIDAYHAFGQGIWDRFSVPSPEKYFWYHGEVLKILKERLNNPIVDRLEKQYEEAKRAVLE